MLIAVLAERKDEGPRKEDQLVAGNGFQRKTQDINMGAQVEVVAVQESYTGAFPKRRLLHNVMRATESPCFLTQSGVPASR